MSFMGAANTVAGELLGQAIGTAVMADGTCTYDTFVLLSSPAAGDVIKLRGDGTKAGFEQVCGPIPDDKYREVDGKATTDQYFQLQNLCNRIDELVAAKGA